MHVVAEVKQQTIPFIPQQPRAVVENMFAAFARKDMVALREAFASEVTFFFQGSVFGREHTVVNTHGFEGLVEFFQEADAKLQVQEFKPETIIADGSHVVAIGHESGIEIATGAAFRVHFVQHFEVADGRIARMTEYRVWITQESPRENEVSSGFRLPAAPKEVQPYFRDTFNAGDLDALMRMYADTAVFVPTPGMALDQPEAIRKATADFMGLKLPFAMTPRHLYVSGDTALMISDWVLEGTGPDGKPMKLTGTTADVAREQADGTWRVIIDNPFGIERMFAKAGMGLDAVENLVYLEGHKGPHPAEYHSEVYQRLEEELGDCRTVAQCRGRLVHALKRLADDVCTPGSVLHQWVTKT